MFLVEFFNKNFKSIILNLTHQPPNGDPNELENHFKNILSKREITNKELVLVGDFNINILDFNESKMIQGFVNLMSRDDLIPIVNKPTRVTWNTTTAIDHIIANSVLSRLTYAITFSYSSWLNVLLTVPRAGKNSYTNEVTQAVQ